MAQEGLGETKTTSRAWHHFAVAAAGGRGRRHDRRAHPPLDAAAAAARASTGEDGEPLPEMPTAAPSTSPLDPAIASTSTPSPAPATRRAVRRAASTCAARDATDVPGKAELTRLAGVVRYTYVETPSGGASTSSPPCGAVDALHASSPSRSPTTAPGSPAIPAAMTRGRDAAPARRRRSCGVSTARCATRAKGVMPSPREDRTATGHTPRHGGRSSGTAAWSLASR